MHRFRFRVATLLALVVTATAHADSWYVDDDSAATAPDGLGWSTAFTSLQEALSVAMPGDTIFVAGGSYKPTSTSDRTESFTLGPTIVVIGGHAGASATDPSTYNPSLYPTILTGDLAGDDAGPAGDPSRSENSHNVVVMGAADVETQLDSVTIRGGNADDPSVSAPDHRRGAGIRIGGAQASSPRISNCIIKENRTANGPGGGAGVAVLGSGSAPRFTNCRILNNAAQGASQRGGGVLVEDGAPVFVLSNFESNDADFGGGLHAFSAVVRLVSCSVLANSAATQGGGVDALGGTSNAAPQLTNCLLAENTSDGVGGAIASSKSDLTVEACTVVGNTAALLAGGWYAITSHDDSADSVILSSIFWSNGGTTAADQIGGDVAMLPVSWSDVQGGWLGVTNLDVDPAFVDEAAGNYRLQRGSVLEDAGPAGGGALPTDDLDIDDDLDFSEKTPDRDRTRRVVGGAVDVGAYEACPADTNLDGAIDVTDLVNVILDWGTDGSAHGGDVAGETASDPPNGVVDVQDLVVIILHWERCDYQSAPQTMWDCIDRVGNDPAALMSCWEAMDVFVP